MHIYRLEDELGRGPVGHDGLELDKYLLEYWEEHVEYVEPDGECQRLGHELGLKGHDTTCFGCLSYVTLVQYWGKLFNEYQNRGLIVVVYNIPNNLISRGEMQVAFPRILHNPSKIVRVYDWPKLDELKEA